MKFMHHDSAFVTSTFSDRGRHCVAVSIQPDRVLVTNSKCRDAVVSFTMEEWRVFLLGAKAGEFDISVE
ncbi:MAG: DUF397 domain-containing protein [Sulfuritalea sp.]|nr:DUF397 domain-containing protein [Sulfuritalea sp.]